MQKLHFSKYEGLGNDFIIIDEMHLSVKNPGQREPSLSLENRIKLCDRHRGIGADGIITVFHSEVPGTIAYMHITNQDGSTPEMCGNGFRCVVKWLADSGKLPNNTSALLTDDGVKTFKLDGNMCTVDMGLADFQNATANGPMRHEPLSLPKELSTTYTPVHATAVKIGNPHLVLEMQVSDAQAKSIGSYLEFYPAFQNRTNVEFVSLISPLEIDIKVWERGAGLTNACGTGACASVAVFADAGKLLKDHEIKVSLPGGELFVFAQSLKAVEGSADEQLRLTMRGPANRVFTGVIP